MITNPTSWSPGPTPYKSPNAFHGFGLFIRGHHRVTPFCLDCRYTPRRRIVRTRVRNRVLLFAVPMGDFRMVSFIPRSVRYQIISDICRYAFAGNGVYHLDLSVVARFSVRRSKNDFQIIDLCCPSVPNSIWPLGPAGAEGAEKGMINRGSRGWGLESLGYSTFRLDGVRRVLLASARTRFASLQIYESFCR